MSHLKNAVRWIVNILTGFLLIILVMVIYGKCVLMFTDNKYPNYFGYTFFEVASGSMEPTLYINDVIIIKITDDNLKKNDIIAFNNEGTIITHRIVFIDGNMLTVKGDNNNTIDVPIDKKQVIGKVVKILPKFGIWKKIITEPKILGLIFITLLLFDFALSYNKPSVKNEKKKKKVNNVSVTNTVNVVSDTNLNDKKVDENKKDIIESDELLEITRKINIDEINDLLEKQEIVLSKREKKTIYDEVNNTNVKVKKEKSTLKKKKSTDYTMRLDLNEIQKKINSKVK